jgi:protein involved in polysaccharide export with SLBB domain
MLVAFVLSLAPALAQADPPAIGPGDVLRLRVLEWRADTGEATTWEAFDGEFTVGPDGSVTLPLVGAVRASGRAPDAVGREIGERLQEATGLLRAPSASVEIARHRPFYVVGAVEAPGGYAYAPGLRVLQAVSLAGGLRRGYDALDRFEREAISSRGELRVIALELDQLAARRARLAAELEDAEEIAFPDRLVERAETDPTVRDLLREEELIHVSRRESLEQEIAASEQLESMLEQQIAQLEEQAALKEAQIASIVEEVERVRDLVERGLGTASRLSELERRLADYEADRGDITRSIIGAQVDVNQARRDAIKLRADRRRQVAREIRETQGEMATLRERFGTARRLLRESEVIAPAKQAAAERRATLEPIFSIVRTVDGETREVAADELAPVRPGDTVRVVVPVPDIEAPLSGAPVSAAPPEPGEADLAASAGGGPRR